MTFRRGMKRLALFLGALGAVVGGVASSIELDNLITQRSNHRKFEQLVSTDVVQQQRKLLKSIPPPPNGEDFFPNPDYKLPAVQGEMNKSGIAEIHWTPDHEVDYLKTVDGQYYLAGSAPRWWQYFLTLTLPIVGFFIPWGLVTALVWVCSGFIEPQA